MSPTLKMKPRLLLRRTRYALVILYLKNYINYSQFLDGPAEDGEMFMRPGKLADYFPRYCHKFNALPNFL